jgi:hypothetical protein
MHVRPAPPPCSRGIEGVCAFLCETCPSKCLESTGIICKSKWTVMKRLYKWRSKGFPSLAKGHSIGDFRVAVATYSARSLVLTYSELSMSPGNL